MFDYVALWGQILYLVLVKYRHNRRDVSLLIMARLKEAAVHISLI